MDLIEEFSLPSEGKIYKTEIKWENRIRAPRLCDKGIGDLSKKNKIQAGVLEKCILEPLGINPYDLHSSDYTYLNLKQRMAAKGSKMMLDIRCQCGNHQEEEIDLNEVKIVKPKLPFDLNYTMATGEEIELRYFTPRILDQIKDNVSRFKEDYPDATQDVSLQETCRAIIVSVDGEKLPYSQMTNFLLNSYEVDLINMIDKVLSTNFGPVLIQKRRCSECKNLITFSISPDKG